MTKAEEQNKVDEKLLSHVANLAHLVDYQEVSVVSRTIVEKTTGTVTIFAFDKGQSLSEHTAPFDALVYIVEGEAGITISGESFYLKGGDTIIMPANEPHSLEALNKFKMMLVMIKS